MPDVKSCKMCKKLFNYLGGQPICPACQKKLEDKFQEVKTFIEEHDGASMDEVAKECEAPKNQIKKWIQEERLMIKEGSTGIVLNCENCGAPILTGRYCENCKRQVADGLDSLIKKPTVTAPKKKVKEKERMRFLEK